MYDTVVTFCRNAWLEAIKLRHPHASKPKSQEQIPSHRCVSCRHFKLFRSFPRGNTIPIGCATHLGRHQAQRGSAMCKDCLFEHLEEQVRTRESNGISCPRCSRVWSPPQVFKVLGSGGEHGKARQQQYELVIQREKEERMWRREGW